MPPDDSDTQMSLGARRTARVLQAISTGEWSLSGLARELGVERRTLGRVVAGLEHEGFVVRGRAGRLAPGPTFVSAARSVSRDSGLVALAAEVVTDLARVTGCTSMLHLAHGDHLLPEVIRTPSDAIAISFPPGRSIELWRGIGRAFLLHSPPSEVLRLAAASGRDDFEEVVRREREAGFAVSHGELVPGITAIGAPVLGPSGVVAVLAVIGLEPELPDLFGEPLCGAAARLSRQIATGRC